MAGGFMSGMISINNNSCFNIYEMVFKILVSGGTIWSEIHLQHIGRHHSWCSPLLHTHTCTLVPAILPLIFCNASWKSYSLITYSTACISAWIILAILNQPFNLIFNWWNKKKVTGRGQIRWEGWTVGDSYIVFGQKVCAEQESVWQCIVVLQ